MGSEKDVSKGAAASEGAASHNGSTKRMKAVNDEAAERVPDPSANFLKRKARLREEAAAAKKREEAAAQPDPPSKRDFTGGYRGNTTSGSFRPSMHGHGK
jgi:hypothetical protein